MGVGDTVEVTLTSDVDPSVSYALTLQTDKAGQPGWNIGKTPLEAPQRGQRGTISIVDQSGGSGQKVAREFKKYLLANGWLADRPGVLIPRGAASNVSVSTDAAIVAAANRRGAIFSVADQPYVIVTPAEIFEGIAPVAKKAPGTGCVFTGSHARFGNRVFFGEENAVTAEGCLNAVRISSGSLTPITESPLTSGSGGAPTAGAVTEFPLDSGSAGAGGGAISHAARTLLNDPVSRSSYSTMSYTPTANRLLLAAVLSTSGSPTGLSGNGLKWVFVKSNVAGNLTVWRAMGSAPTAGALTATFAAAAPNCIIQVTEFTNVDTSGVNGAGAIVQAPRANGTSITPVVNLPGVASPNGAYGAFAVSRASTTPNVTAGSGFAEIAESSVVHTTLYVEADDDRTNDFVDATADASSTWSGIGIEIKAAGSGSGTSFQTASKTPTLNRLQLLAVYSTSGGATAAPVPTVSGCGLTWVQVATVTLIGGNRRVTVFRALGTPTTGKLAIAFSIAQSVCRWAWSEFANIDTSGTNGSGAIVQAVTKNTDTSAASSTITLAAFGSASNATFGAFVHNATSGVTPGSGFTEVFEVVDTGTLETEWKNSSDTTVDASNTGGALVAWAGIALEIKVASSATFTYQTASITPTAGRLQIAAVYNDVSSPGIPTLTGNDLTWVQIKTVTVGNFRLTLFRAMGTPTAGVVSIAFALAQTACRWSIMEFAGVADGGTDGSGAIVQSVSASGTSTTPLVTLGAFADPDNAAFGSFGAAITSGITPGSGFTEIHDVAASSGELQTEWRDDADTTVDATIASAAWLGIAIEIARASTAAGDYEDADFEANYLTLVGSRLFRLRYDATAELWYESWTDELNTSTPSWSTEYPVTGARRSTADLRTLGPNPIAGVSGIDLAAEFYSMDTEGNFTSLIPEGMGVTNIVAGGAFFNGQVFLLSGTPRALWFRDLFNAMLLNMNPTPPDDTLSEAVTSTLGGVSGIAETLWAALNNQILYGNLATGQWTVNQLEALDSSYSVLAIRAWPDSDQVKVDVLLRTASEITVRTYLIYNNILFPGVDTDEKVFTTSIWDGEVWVSKRFTRLRGFVTVDTGTLTFSVTVDGAEVFAGSVNSTGSFAFTLPTSAIGRGLQIVLTGTDFMGAVELPLEVDYYYLPDQRDIISLSVSAMRNQQTRGGTVDRTSRQTLEEALRPLVDDTPGTWTLEFWDKRNPWTVIPLQVGRVSPTEVEFEPSSDGSAIQLLLQRL